MKQINYNVVTQTETIIEVPDEPFVEPAPMIDPDAELTAAISAATTLTQLKDALLGKGRTAKVDAKAK